MLTLRNPVAHTQADGYQAGAEGERKENKMGADGFVDRSQRGPISADPKLSARLIHLLRALPGDGGAGEVFKHPSSKRKKRNLEPRRAAVSKRMTK